MTKQEVIAYYGSVAAVADALNITHQSVTAWADAPPYLRQCQIQVVTKGKLKAGPNPRR